MGTVFDAGVAGNKVFSARHGAGGGASSLADSGNVALDDLDIGTLISIRERDISIPYLVVNKGLPGTGNLYDPSCNGIWLWRFYITETMAWSTASSNCNSYADSLVHSYLNGEYLDRYDPSFSQHIRTVKVPYRPGYGTSKTIASGSNGLTCSAFLLDVTEAGYMNLDGTSARYPIMGETLSCFVDSDSIPESNWSDMRARGRTFDYGGPPSGWYYRHGLSFRTPGGYSTNGTSICAFSDSQSKPSVGGSAKSSYGIRPCIIVPYNTFEVSHEGYLLY